MVTPMYPHIYGRFGDPLTDLGTLPRYLGSTFPNLHRYGDPIPIPITYIDMGTPILIPITYVDMGTPILIPTTYIDMGTPILILMVNTVKPQNKGHIEDRILGVLRCILMHSETFRKAQRAS